MGVPGEYSAITKTGALNYANDKVVSVCISHTARRAMKIGNKGILLLCLVLFSVRMPAFGRTAPILPSGDYVWFATKHGLHRYERTQDEWSVFSSGVGLAGNDVRDIGIDEGIIWVATDGGISNSDVRFSDWQSYTTTDGLPSNDVRSIAFSEDYVWIGTSEGVARFDKLLEDWESYTEADGLVSNQVNDIAVDGETIWFATSGGISKFEVEFDKWTSYTSEAELPSLNVTWALILGDYAWFITDAGLTRYDKRLRLWKSYRMADGIVSYLINDVVTDGDGIWLATQDGVTSYDPVSDSWLVGLAYHAMLPSKNVVDLAMDGNFIWFCTDSGISSYNTETGSWRHFTTADGLLDNSAQGIAVSGQVLVMTEKGVNLYDKNTQEWDTYEFPQETAGGAAEGRRERGLRLDDQGVGFDLSQDTKVRLSGSSSLEFTDAIRLRPDESYNSEWDPENDISLKGTLPGKRSVVGFYDDTREDNIEYGVTYRGNDTDLLHEATGGEFEVRTRSSGLIESVNLLGGEARLRKNLDGARLNVEPRYGRQRGYFETDFFIYKTGTAIYELSHRNVIPETDEVTVNREKLQRVEDYTIVYPNGWLTFPREELIEEGERIEIRYQYEPADEDSENRNLAILTAGIDMGDDYYAGLDMFHRDDLDVISLNGKGERINVGPVSMKLRPEIAYSRRQNGDAADGIASTAELTANAPRVQFKANYEGYSQDFSVIGRRETRFGELDRRLRAFSKIDMTQWMPLTVRWQQDKSDDDDMVTTSEDYAMMNLVLSKKPYPTIALTGERETASSSKQKETENSARADFQYDLPEAALSLVRFRRAEVNGYYKEARRDIVDEKERVQTGYAKLNLHPMERFVVSTSYKLNRAKNRPADSNSYQLREELQQLLIRSDFSAIDGIISTLYLDDLRYQSPSAEGDLMEDRDRFFAASLNLIPGAWTRKLEMLTVASRYSLIQQTVPIAVEDAETEKEQLADSNARSIRLQTNLKPHSAVMWTGTYERVKSWIQGVPGIGNRHRYRSETEFKPGSGSRIVLEYYQEREDEDSAHQERLYMPSLWWETRWSQKWTTRIRSIYEYTKIREDGEIIEASSTLTPSFSFRYTARELPYGGRLYLSQGFSVSASRGERFTRDLKSETYSTSFVTEWKITRNFSLRVRASISYEDDRTQSGSDESTANVYARAIASF